MRPPVARQIFLQSLDVAVDPGMHVGINDFCARANFGSHERFGHFEISTQSHGHLHLIARMRAPAP
jgi:hypothetical protein